MGNRWNIDDDKPPQTEKYKWRLPNNDQQHVAQTTTPGALLIKPEDVSLVPTLSPKRSGVQHGADSWTDHSAPDSTWYILPTIMQEDN